MPYSGPSDKSLPSNVKKLGEKQRRQWLNVFNSSLKRCNAKGGKGCEAAAFKVANGVLKKSATFVALLGGEEPLGRPFIEFAAAEPPETINIFPIPGTYKHPVWGDFEVTEEGNKEFVDNFNAHVYQEHVALDAEHETKVSGAVGYLTSLSLNDDGSIEAAVDWTGRGIKLIEDDRFAYISPEWFEQWTDPASGDEYQNVLIGGALTTRPFFKDMRSLVASAGRLYDMEEPDGERTPVIRSSVEGVSYEDLRVMILSAARHEFPGVVGTGDYAGWVADLYDDHVIIEASNKYWHLDYAYDGGAITFSDQPKEVRRVTGWEDAPHQADDKEVAKTHSSKRTKAQGNTDSTKKKEGHMTEPDVKELEATVTGLDEGERKGLLERIATSLKASISFGSDDDNDDAGDDPKPGAKGEDGEPKTAAEIVALQTKLTASEEAREASDKRLTGLEATERERRFRDIILGRDDAGVKQAKEATPAVVLHPMVGDLAAKMQIMEALAATKGEGSGEFKAYVAGEREHASQLHAAGTFGETGQDAHGEGTESTAKREYEARIATLTTGDNPISEGDAIKKIAKEDPALYDRYDRERTGRKGALAS